MSGRHRGETPLSRKRELKLIRAIAGYMGVDYGQVPPDSGKYLIDGWLHKNGRVVAWLECKWTSDGSRCFAHLNAPKFAELCLLAALYKCHSYYIVREEGKWGYAIIHDGSRCMFDREVRITGGTPAHRPPNDDDIEPCVKIPKSEITWVS